MNGSKYADSYRDSEKRRFNDRNDKLDRPIIKRAPETKAPAGFPEGCLWSKGDWLCPSVGCEGFVTLSRSRNCINCGRSQPHFTVLMELAKGFDYRTQMCPNLANCPGRDCVNAHHHSELRDLVSLRVLKKSDSVPLSPSPTREEIGNFLHRWKIMEPGISVLGRLPGVLCDLVIRSFAVPADVPDSSLTQCLLKSLADMIRPRSVTVSTQSGFHELLTALLKVYSGPIGVACSNVGQLAIALEKDVWLVRCRDYSNEDLGLLVFALTFTGIAVVHSLTDTANLISNFPKVYVDLFNRVRTVDNPSEIIYRATDPAEEVTDRATQARVDALTNPAPLLPTPDTHA